MSESNFFSSPPPANSIVPLNAIDIIYSSPEVKYNFFIAQAQQLLKQFTQPGLEGVRLTMVNKFEKILAHIEQLAKARETLPHNKLGTNAVKMMALQAAAKEVIKELIYSAKGIKEGQKIPDAAHFPLEKTALKMGG
jgi:hypothetical protein